MKLLVVLLCLLSERFLIHRISYQRFSWFGTYAELIQGYTSNNNLFTNPWFGLAALVAPIVLVVAALYFLLHGILFGFAGLLLNIAIFYYCLGPQNAFYPVTEKKSKNAVGDYFAAVNNQLFAAVFWFVACGPIAVLLYRLISQSQQIKSVSACATMTTNILEWIPARLTALLYLLAGNFQSGLSTLMKFIIATPELNHALLSECGLKAVRTDDSEELPMPVAESLVEHATIVLLVFVALFTLAAWL